MIEAAKRKRCCRCGVTKTAGAFGMRVTNACNYVLQSWCIDCRMGRLTTEVPEIGGREAVKTQYQQTYPNDKCTSRSLNFMLGRLAKRKNGSGSRD